MKIIYKIFKGFGKIIYNSGFLPGLGSSRHHRSFG